VVAVGGSSNTVTFTLVDECDDGAVVQLKFFDESLALVWPSTSTHYATKSYGVPFVESLVCNAGSKICFGGRSASTFWGVDVDNSKPCDDCCIWCTDANSLSTNLYCAAG
jgi:hypothetical protein